jgi:hypothetical protein
MPEDASQPANRGTHSDQPYHQPAPQTGIRWPFSGESPDDPESPGTRPAAHPANQVDRPDDQPETRRPDSPYPWNPYDRSTTERVITGRLASLGVDLDELEERHTAPENPDRDPATHPANRGTHSTQPDYQPPVQPAIRRPGSPYPWGRGLGGPQDAERDPLVNPANQGTHSAQPATRRPYSWELTERPVVAPENPRTSPEENAPEDQNRRTTWRQRCPTSAITVSSSAIAELTFDSQDCRFSYASSPCCPG